MCIVDMPTHSNHLIPLCPLAVQGQPHNGPQLGDVHRRDQLQLGDLHRRNPLPKAVPVLRRTREDREVHLKLSQSAMMAPWVSRILIVSSCLLTGFPDSVVEERLEAEPVAGMTARADAGSEIDSHGHDMSGDSGTDYSETRRTELALRQKRADRGETVEYTDDEDYDTLDEDAEGEPDEDAEGESDEDELDQEPDEDELDDKTKRASRVRKVSTCRLIHSGIFIDTVLRGKPRAPRRESMARSELNGVYFPRPLERNAWLSARELRLRRKHSPRSYRSRSVLS